jgi:hypothetical protein
MQTTGRSSHFHRLTAMRALWPWRGGVSRWARDARISASEATLPFPVRVAADRLTSDEDPPDTTPWGSSPRASPAGSASGDRHSKRPLPAARPKIRLAARRSQWCPKAAEPRARVFEALTDPAIIQQWSAPEPLRVGEVSNDARVGGRWLIEMIQDEAGERHVAVGRDLEIDSPARLRYTHAWLEDG